MQSFVRPGLVANLFGPCLPPLPHRQINANAGSKACHAGPHLTGAMSSVLALPHWHNARQSAAAEASLSCMLPVEVVCTFPRSHPLVQLHSTMATALAKSAQLSSAACSRVATRAAAVARPVGLATPRSALRYIDKLADRRTYCQLLRTALLSHQVLLLILAEATFCMTSGLCASQQPW